MLYKRYKKEQSSLNVRPKNTDKVSDDDYDYGRTSTMLIIMRLYTTVAV